jgi:hypothetical protein
MVWCGSALWRSGGEVTMRLYLVLAMLAAALSASGCLGPDSTQTYRWACTDRPYDAGFCEQPTNWRLFGPRTGPLIGIR